MLLRSRALDNQVYCAGISPARDLTAGYPAWSHSRVANPYGDIIAEGGIEEDIIYADIDMDKLIQIRDQMPMNDQRRLDMYQLSKLTD